ncbi:hypothetical protein HUO14_03750 [Parasphingorhabdus flavimaris]|uniref:Uncharacterized protein n=1 Tax=Parasphingorhabdus flavimaris TaxID=266812 RepID=A0ABX2MZZ6_9SPHN|nr:DUF6632 domain-containing protein [Parasphingorhabdus flavimaris]NVD27022.1 hypothetical protein [Parasphingorhabdus flavimaris]|tara:strand:+ start:7854 stop:8246 length:393 start_codon:yes stop_codon:yes gene_type:complete
MIGRYSFLQVALVLFGAIFCLVYPLALVWPSGWMWHEGPPVASHYYVMILGIYLTLGLMLIRAAANPAANRSLIWFTIWSSVVHAGIMAVQAMQNPEHIGHMLGDVPALLLVAVVLGVLMPKADIDVRAM